VDLSFCLSVASGDSSTKGEVSQYGGRSGATRNASQEDCKFDFVKTLSYCSLSDQGNICLRRKVQETLSSRKLRSIVSRNKLSSWYEACGADLPVYSRICGIMRTEKFLKIESADESHISNAKLAF